MSLQKKYYFSFKSIINQQYTVEIWQNITGTTLTAVEILGDESPFIVQYPSITKFEPVRGSGCSLNLISQTDGQFFNLFTANYLEYQLRLYKGNNLIWCGFLDSELFTEDFSQLWNYPVSFSGSDGFAVLERINYLDNNLLHYSGITSQFEVIKNIVNKLGLPYNAIYFNVSTTSTELTIASNETIFHKTYVINSDYYNEDNEAETCRTVLEHQLAPYGGFIIQNNGSLFITDVNVVAAGGTTTFQKFDSSFNYIGTEAINLNIGDLSTIRFADTAQTRNVVPGFNKQIIKYQPYAGNKIMDFSPDSDFSGSGSTSSEIGTYGYKWTETTYPSGKTFINYPSNGSYFCNSTGLDGENVGNKEYYLKINTKGLSHLGMTDSGQVINPTFTTIKELPTLIGSNQYFIKLNISAFFRTTNDLNNPADKPTLIVAGILQTKINCGDYHLQINNIIGTPNYGLPYWASGGTENFYITMVNETNPDSKSSSNSKFNPMENTWVDFKKSKIITDGLGGYKLDTKDFLIPLINIDYDIDLNPIFYPVDGLLTFSLFDYRVYTIVGNFYVETTCIDCRIKDIKLTIVDSLGNEINDDDIEYVGYMNSFYKDEGQEITLYNGTSINQNPCERGSLLKYDGNTYNFIQSWTRQNKTDLIENLLLRSVVSNYTDKTIEFSFVSNSISSVLGTLTYNNYLSGIKLMPISCNLDYYNENAEITAQQVIIDSLDINKSFGVIDTPTTTTTTTIITGTTTTTTTIIYSGICQSYWYDGTGTLSYLDCSSIVINTSVDGVGNFNALEVYTSDGVSWGLN